MEPTTEFEIRLLVAIFAFMLGITIGYLLGGLKWSQSPAQPIGTVKMYGDRDDR